MPTLLQDLRYSLRQLIQNPGFALTAVISLALGIGATTAMFSVIYAALLNPYPYPAADRLVRLTIDSKEVTADWADLNGPQIKQLRQVPLVESVLAMDGRAMLLTGGDLPENVIAVGLAANGFEDLGVPPVLGRGLLPSDAMEGQEPQPVAVLGYRFWQKHFLSSPDVLGKTLQLDRKNYLIVGVAAPRFTWYSAEVYLPLQPAQDVTYIINLRLKPVVTYAAADAALQPLLEQFAKDMPAHFPASFKVRVEGLNAWVVRSIGGTLYLLFGAVALLLAIGCGNVSILLLARGTARQHELAVRSALGAQRRRIVRQLLTESLLLAAIGAGMGVLMAYGILAGMKVVLPRWAFAPEVVIRINLPVLFFSVAVAMATGVLFGLGPALRLSQTRVGQMMQSSGRRVAGGVRGRRTHNLLIAGQMALTLLLLAGAGSALKSFMQLLHTPLGYDPDHVLAVAIPLRVNSYATWGARAAYIEQLRAKVAETPSVIIAAISSNATPPRNGWRRRFEILGQPPLEEQTGSINLVSPEYFSALHIPLLQGRMWSGTENHNAAPVALINRTLAQRYFPQGDAIGHSVKVPDIEDRPPEIVSAPNAANTWFQIVGIVEDARNDGLRNPIQPAIFVPYALSMEPVTQFLVRSAGPPLALVHAVRAQLAAVNPEQQTFGVVADLETWISYEPEWQQEQAAAWIFAVFACLALALAAVGLYSVVSYAVQQRTNEFGIRMALGARRGHVLRIVFASTVMSVGSGIVAGLALAAALSTILEKWAQGSSRDPIVLVAGAILLSVVAGIACAVPARHASRVDPMTALRYE